ncbi:MAG: hypothetical protein FGM46_00075 [Ferruginibacter sp.]|nr:hypothetical protein [Ferruginibacter sp.]
MAIAFIERIKNNLKEKKKNKIINKWYSEGCPVPTPHIIKQLAIQSYQKQSGIDILVETGTFRGDMVEAQMGYFKQIFSIELSEKLWQDARDKFRSYNNIAILQGDSGKVLKDVMLQLKGPAVFWLDGHYSAGETAKGDKECPIFEEIDSIFTDKRFSHILLVDDARCFNGQGDYPTIDALTNYIQSKDASYKVEVKDDIIRFTK